MRTASQSIWLATAITVATATAGSHAAEPARDCSDDITLQTLAWTAAQEVIAGHPGKVVLVNVWTTTCPTCVEHFPAFAKVHASLHAQGLVCVSVNCDHDGIPDKPPEYYAPAVLEFLKQHDARLTNILLTDPLLDFLDAAGIDATPTYRLYGRDGKLIREFDGSAEEFTFDQVAQAVESAVSPDGAETPAEEGD